MAVALDASMTGGNSADGLNQQVSAAAAISSTGLTIIAASLLVVVFHAQNNSAAITNLAGTWNGVQALTKAIQADNTGALHKNSSAVLYLINPTAGAKTLALTWTTSSDVYMSAVAFTGTDTSTGINVTDNVSGTTGTTVTVTSTTDGATVAAWGTDGSTPTVNFNKIYAEAPLAPGGGASYQLGGTSNGHTFTGAGGASPAWTAVHVLAAAGGGATTRGKPFGQRGNAFNGGRTFDGIITRAFAPAANGLWLPERRIIVPQWRKAA